MTEGETSSASMSSSKRQAAASVTKAETATGKHPVLSGASHLSEATTRPKVTPVDLTGFQEFDIYSQSEPKSAPKSASREWV
ncbi:hypothetical protein LAV84_18380 [Rhizobium sp. VS19-DR104.2]|uniref:hypothetical protein n=1 Tax=unclassified Rhizobium TaxID=2613769 RepID=UPI001CC66B8C|nr:MULTISPECIES: hypothetical protein [unclassified Rhizobium]MBZ5761566.1 hypothetical protein [Rhizobium sp. VS19-DR96]MBZ5767514.1 hypothetical protein [Rhizobium sp. VS19-DR129.2]MBZ5775037.1 hypothetical protein [Rhizobium sp. VS19-DRK62.2]MBZ5785998.1 hypothetical protein [Rhizobium sp. VS19-DR121]MBZ5803424.1 hypothetical protein [Rhizobium sp. VS19-DR181]